MKARYCKSCKNRVSKDRLIYLKNVFCNHKCLHSWQERREGLYEQAKHFGRNPKGGSQ